MASITHKFYGKIWQIRSVQNVQTKEWFAFPFVVNSGGMAWCNPILSDGALKRMGFANPVAIRGVDMPGCKHVKFPAPIGPITEPLVANWGTEHKVAPDETRYDFCLTYLMRNSFNLMGEELAECVLVCNFLAKDIVDQGKQDDSAYIAGQQANLPGRVGVGPSVTVRLCEV